MSDSANNAEQDEEFWVRYPDSPDQRRVYIRVIDRSRAEIIGDGGNNPREISLYEVWQTDRQTGLSPTSRRQTPWGDGDLRSARNDAEAGSGGDDGGE